MRRASSRKRTASVGVNFDVSLAGGPPTGQCSNFPVIIRLDCRQKGPPYGRVGAVLAQRASVSARWLPCVNVATSLAKLGISHPYDLPKDLVWLGVTDRIAGEAMGLLPSGTISFGSAVPAVPRCSLLLTD